MQKLMTMKFRCPLYQNPNHIFFCVARFALLEDEGNRFILQQHILPSYLSLSSKVDHISNNLLHDQSRSPPNG